MGITLGVRSSGPLSSWKSQIMLRCVNNHASLKKEWISFRLAESSVRPEYVGEYLQYVSHENIITGVRRERVIRERRFYGLVVESNLDTDPIPAPKVDVTRLRVTPTTSQEMAETSYRLIQWPGK
ncbi:hypothetical protein Btru_024372 [Bulinus truncatus]|nr:hypothetical protein Btru_024372 [Bulinus truncatus]